MLLSYWNDCRTIITLMRSVEELECIEIDYLSLFQIQRNTNERGQKCRAISRNICT